MQIIIVIVSLVTLVHQAGVIVKREMQQLANVLAKKVHIDYLRRAEVS